MSADQQRTQPLAGSSAASVSGTVWKNRYLIERELGRGGFGIVFLARDQQLLSKPVVVKLLQDGSSPDPYFQKKFQQEIEAMARIDHPGVVGVLDTGESPEKQPFLVMQFVEGDTLRSLINKGGVEFRQAARILRQVGQALSAAHDKGVFHRDLKPENIMVQHLSDDEIQVKLIDFGIASVRDSQVLSGHAQGQPQASKVVGTLAYMAPEQFMGQATGSSDIYALGVIAFEMLTGQRPEITPQGLTTKPRQIRADIPEAAESAIIKAVSYQPEQRQARPRDFGEEIARALGAEASISAPVPAVAAAATSSSSEGLEFAFVLFMDLVSYSMLPMDLQSQRIQHLAQIVRNTSEYRRAQQANQIISLPTGDGMALVFFQNPVAPVQCAIEVARELKKHPELKLRMGVHTGPVYRIADINTNSNVAGGGINSAQRIMDVGDAGHILVSKSVADTLNQLSDWSKTLQDLGEAEVKHGVKMHVVNLVTSDVGNPELPEKFKKARTLVEQIPSAPALPAVAARHAGPAPVAPQPQAPAVYQQNWNQPPAGQASKAGTLLAVGAAVIVVAGVAAWQLGMFGGNSKGSDRSTPGAVPAEQTSSAPIPAAQPSGTGNGNGVPNSPGSAGGAAAVAAAVGAKTAAASSERPSGTASQVAKVPPAAAATATVTVSPIQTAPANSQPTAPTAASAAPPSAALGGLRSDYAMLAGRANSVANSLGRMEQQQGRMGVGLRTDMAAARDSMEYLMGEAKSALSAGDADEAKRNMDMAERQVEKLEEFLGR
jgi:serine/threonine protein kinase